MLVLACKFAKGFGSDCFKRAESGELRRSRPDVSPCITASNGRSGIQLQPYRRPNTAVLSPQNWMYMVAAMACTRVNGWNVGLAKMMKRDQMRKRGAYL